MTSNASDPLLPPFAETAANITFEAADEGVEAEFGNAESRDTGGLQIEFSEADAIGDEATPPTSFEQDQPEFEVNVADDAAAVTASESAPSWFARKRAQQETTDGARKQQPPARPQKPRKKRRTKKDDKPKIFVADEEEVALPWPEQVKEWIKGQAAQGFASSCVIHILLLIILSIIVLSGKDKPFAITTTMSDSEDDSFEFDDSLDTELDMAAAAEVDQSAAMQALTNELLKQSVPSALEMNIAALAGDGEESNGAGFRMPSSGKVVRKGSFTAWTVPEDPMPGQAYLIVIQIKVPKRVKRYSERDLTGFMRGNDGYSTPIGYNQRDRRYYGRFDMKAKQFVIRIPGAEAEVRDKIHVESKILKEKQELEIVF